MDEQRIKNVAFQYLYPTSNTNMLLELPLTAADPFSAFFEQVNGVRFEVFGNASTGEQGIE